MKKLTLQDIVISIIVEDESFSAYTQLGECMSKEEISELLEEARTSNVWKWCMVEVKGTYKGLESSEYLGGCSYDSEEDFINNSEYYNDMCEAVLSDLQKQVEEIISDFTN